MTSLLRPDPGAPVLTLATRRPLRRVARGLPIALAGLSILGLWLLGYGLVYENQFRPWDLMADVPSRSAPIAALRRSIELGWFVSAPLGLLAGWQAARRLGRRSFLLPGLYLGALVVVISQADVFVGHNRWSGRELRTTDVDSVTVPAVVLASVVLGLPLLFVAADSALERRRRRLPNARDPRQGPGPSSGPVPG